MITQAKADKMLSKLKAILRIEDWDVSVELMSQVDYTLTHGQSFKYDTNGCTEIINGTCAKIYLRTDIPDDELKTVLIHECVHLVTFRYDEFVTKTLTHVDSKKIAKVFKNEALWEMEIMVSKITTILKSLIKL